jgi:EAL and modified HD-GYP domain-containing signal transduction protein
MPKSLSSGEDTVSESAGALRYVARQPILDLQGKVYGYELLFRAGPEAVFRGDGDMATRTMLDNASIFGLERLTSGLPAFVNCTMESLTERLVDILPPQSTVLEILETLEPTRELIAACHELKARGYRIALDDFIWKPKFDPLVEVADYIKVDFIQTGEVERRELLKRLSGTRVVLLAEKVETLDEYSQAQGEGFTLFQGYYFCRPLLVKNRRVPANQLSYIQILKHLRDEPLNLQLLGPLVKKDAALTYRLLRLVNSPICAVRQEVCSIKAALTLVGDNAFRRMATLAITSELNANRPPEILRMAYVRGRFCELAAGFGSLGQSEQYLLGIFSLLPAMLGVPMADLAPALPLRGRILDALLGAVSCESSLLRWAESFERGDWSQCDAVEESYGLNQERLILCHAEATIWTDDALHFGE